jgi:hypothetical protein
MAIVSALTIGFSDYPIYIRCPKKRSKMKNSYYSKGKTGLSWLLSSFLLLVAFTGSAQVNSYTFSQVAGTYSPISGGTVHQSGTALNTDAVFTNIPLGFNFTYNRNQYSSIGISNNGFIWFGAPNSGPRQNWFESITPGNAISAPISTTTNPSSQDGLVAGFGATLSASASGSPEIRSELTGTPGNYVFVIQYQDVRSSTTDASMALTFQIRLVEANNSIQIVYGPTTAPSANRTGQVGLRGANQLDYSNRLVTGAWNASTPGTANTSTATLSTTNIPASGLTYTWIPPAPPAARTYGSLGTVQTFSGPWDNYAATGDVPNANWASWPSFANNSWRIDNTSAAAAGWSSVFGAFTIAAPAAGNTARFHTYDTRAGQIGNLDYYVDLSTSTGVKELTFDYINTTGSDSLKIFVSTDGGLTFGAPVAAYNVAANWTTATVSLGNINSATSVVRFSARSDFGTTDIGMDNVVVNLAAPMSYVSSTTTQTVTTTVTKGSTNNQIIGLQVVTTGSASPLDLTSLTVNSNGSTNFAGDVSNVNVFYTGNSSAFATTTLFGSASNLSSPITGTQTLLPGTNYFWVTYNISTAATIGNLIDAEITSINLTSGAQTPTVTAPAGNRMIGYCTAVHSVGCSATDNINSVTFNTLSNLNTGCTSTSGTAYTVYPPTGSNTTTLYTGATYSLSVTSTANSIISVWIDYNQNGIFEAAEWNQVATTTTANTPVSINITIPSSALTGVTGMRIRSRFSGNANGANDACASFGSGESEDYTITLMTPPAVDMAATGLAAPISTGCYSANETVSITITNMGSSTVDFSINPVTVNASVTGPNPVTFTPVTLNTGTLAASSSQNVVVSTTYNMTGAGNYTFNASTNATGDGNTANDAMAAVSINVSAGTASVNNSTICSGNSATLTLTGYNGTIQWQSSTDGGTTWNNETGTGNTSATYTVSPTVSTMYQALVCGSLTSNTVSVTVNTSPAPSTTGATRCGAGPVTLGASGTGTLLWYANAAGGGPIFTGTSYTTNLSSTTTYHVSNASGTTGNVGMVTNAGGGGQQTSNAYLIFDVLSQATLIGVHVYPGAAGNVVLELRSSTGTLITSSTVPVTAADVNMKTFIPLNWSLAPGTNYRLAQGAGSVSMYRNSAGVTYPYTLPGIVSITGSSAGASFYYFSYDWLVTTGCISSRTPVTATINTAPAITASSSSSTICSGTSATLNVTSTNTSYSYTWTPATGLSATTGTGITATPSVSTTYTVNALDTAGCQVSQTVAIAVNQSPVVTATATPTVVCSGSPVQLNLTNTTPPPIVTVGTGTITNTNTGYPAPYGNWYWGARHQFLITAAELTAAGMSAGQISSLAFDVTNTNTSAAHTNFTISMGSTSLTSITTFQSGLTQVYTAPTYTAATGWNVHTFSTPFTWNGTDNIIVETCFNNTSYTYNVSVNQSTTSYTSSVYFYQDASGTCTNNTVNGTMSQRPNMRFAMMNTFSYAWTPSSTLNNSSIDNPVATPTATTTYTASVTNTQNGCVTNATVTVTVNPLPVVTATSGAAAICEGSSTTITAAGADTYTWMPSTGLSATSGAMVTANPTVTTTYTVSGTDSNGCINSAPVTLSVNPLPVVTLAAISPVCEDASSFTLTGESPAGGTFSGTGVSGGMFDPAAAGVGAHTVTYTYIDGNGCSNSDSATVTVNALPVVTLSAFAPECSNGTPVALTGESPTGGTFSGMAVSGGMFDPAMAGVGTHTITYTYTDANMCTSSATENITVNAPPAVTLAAMTPVCETGGAVTLGGESPSGGIFSGMGVSAGMFDPALTGPGMHDIIYTYTDSNMCSNSDTATVQVYAAPAVSLASQAPVCANAIAFTITGESPAGGTFSGTGVSGNMFDPSMAGPGMHDIIYTYTDSNMCSNSDTATVMVNALPAITLASYSPVCEGAAMITLTGESPAGGTYSGTAVSGNMFDPVAAGVGTHYVVYTYSDSNSCTGMDSAAIVVNANPVVNLGADITQCGGPVTLDAGNPGSTYAWSNSATTQIVSVTASGTYAVMVTDANACSASDTVMVTINTPAFVDLGADTTICNTSTVTLDAGAGFSSYSWSTGATTQTITVSASGSYTVTVTNADGCQDTDAITVTVTNCDGVAENGNGYLVTAKPNPSEGIFNLVITGAEIEKLNVEIMDIQGKLVQGFVENNISGDFTREINLGGLAKGVYYLRVNTGTTIVTEKLVIQ